MTIVYQNFFMYYLAYGDKIIQNMSCIVHYCTPVLIKGYHYKYTKYILLIILNMYIDNYCVFPFQCDPCMHSNYYRENYVWSPNLEHTISYFLWIYFIYCCIWNIFLTLPLNHNWVSYHKG